MKKEEIEKRLVELSDKYKKVPEIQDIVDRLLEVVRGNPEHNGVRFYDSEKESQKYIMQNNREADAVFIGAEVTSPEEGHINHNLYNEEWILKLTDKGFIFEAYKGATKTTTTVEDTQNGVSINRTASQYENWENKKEEARYLSSKMYNQTGHLIADTEQKLSGEGLKKSEVMERRVEGNKVYANCKGTHPDVDGTYELSGEYVEEFMANRRSLDDPNVIYRMMLDGKAGKISDEYERTDSDSIGRTR